VHLQEEKRTRRSEARANIEALTPDVRREGDTLISRVIAARTEFLECAQLLAYWALPDEVNVTALLRTADHDGKRVFLPRIVGGSIVFGRWHTGDRLDVGPIGVREPTVREQPSAGESTLILVPGRAFSREGHRLGRGMGYYDRAWSGLTTLGRACGVAYACQIFDEVPHDEKDSVVDLLVCENGVVVDRA
jgi:5-formyltetrahydrofolate cyclo-ligase